MASPIIRKKICIHIYLLKIQPVIMTPHYIFPIHLMKSRKFSVEVISSWYGKEYCEVYPNQPHLINQSELISPFLEVNLKNDKAELISRLNKWNILILGTKISIHRKRGETLWKFLATKDCACYFMDINNFMIDFTYSHDYAHSLYIFIHLLCQEENWVLCAFLPFLWELALKVPFVYCGTVWFCDICNSFLKHWLWHWIFNNLILQTSN